MYERDDDGVRPAWMRQSGILRVLDPCAGGHRFGFKSWIAMTALSFRRASVTPRENQSDKPD